LLAAFKNLVRERRGVGFELERARERNKLVCRRKKRLKVF